MTYDLSLSPKLNWKPHENRDILAHVWMLMNSLQELINEWINKLKNTQVNKWITVPRHWGREHVFHSEDQYLGVTTHFLYVLILFHGHKRIIELCWFPLSENNYQLNLTFIGYHSLRFQKCVVHVIGWGNDLYFDTFHITSYSGNLFFYSWIQLFNLKYLR